MKVEVKNTFLDTIFNLNWKLFILIDLEVKYTPISFQNVRFCQTSNYN